MLEIPYTIINCSWPRPVAYAHGRWTSEPEWNAPAMPFRPQPIWQTIHGEPCWTIDWRKLYRGGLVSWIADFGGEMCGFHIVFHLKINGTGKLVFWDDDGCVIRRNGELIHYDNSAHMLDRHEIEVDVGDSLEVAQWQDNGDWLWGARLIPAASPRVASPDVLWPYYETVQQRCAHPNGPPFKMYSHAATPYRTIVSIYSMILNGYVPSQVLLFGEHQWSKRTQELLSTMLPFAEIVPTAEVCRQIRSFGGNELAEMAMRYWWVMKTLVSLLYPPDEFCAMDDDVFILDHTNDALAAFQEHNLVFAPDMDHNDEYVAAWASTIGHTLPLATAKFNAGLYWMRNVHDPCMLADFALQVRPDAASEYVWEQGLIANLYADRNPLRLPTHRYFYPLFDGLPGGMLGYDYKNNPCGFASVHFGGLQEKPTDATALLLAPEILDRHSDGSSQEQTTIQVYANYDTSQITALFDRNWSDPEVHGTGCGRGSTPQHTQSIQRALPSIIRAFDIRVINDAGCGDFSWIRHVELGNVDYLGYDLKQRDGVAGLPFCQLDIIHELMRPCDLVICRDVLFHFPNEVIQTALEKIKQCTKYLLATSLDHTKNGHMVGNVDNRNRHVWNGSGDCGYSHLNLEAEPFNFPPPILAIPERSQSNRFLGLWDLTAF